MFEHTPYTIYILRCEHSKYYVGQTQDFTRRWSDHVAGVGSVWTRKFRPLSVKHTEVVFGKDNANRRENQLTATMKERYGDNFVTGGDYCTEDYRHHGMNPSELKAARLEKGL